MLRRAILILALPVLAGCGSERMAQSGWPSGPAATTASTAQPAPQGGPLVEMAGRWTLSSPGRGQCNMTFNVAPGSAEGTIAPEGGCPGRFFTSRKWGIEQSNLVIRNHNNETLAQLSMAAGSRFDGQSVNGEPVTLTR